MTKNKNTSNFEKAKQKILGKNYKPSVRDYAVTLIVGSQGAGKSALMAELAIGFAKRRDKVLVLDVAGARGFASFRSFSLEQFKEDAALPIGHKKKWSMGVRKIRVTIENQEDILIAVADYFDKGFLFIDELAQTHGRSGDITDWGAKIFLQCRNRKVDVIVAVHKFKDIHISYRGHVKCVHMFNTPEKPESAKYFSDLGFEPDCKELFESYSEIAIQAKTANQIGQDFRIWYNADFKNQIKSQNQVLAQFRGKVLARAQELTKQVKVLGISGQKSIKK